jgi:anti-anti-sigma factor
MVKDIVYVEVLTKDLNGPELATELGQELAEVNSQAWATRAVVDFSSVRYMSSTGFAVLFRIVKDAKAQGHLVKLCGLHPDVRVGADILGLGHMVEIYLDDYAAFQSFLDR